MITWPAPLWIVRHGESASNFARDVTHASGANRIEFPARDVDIPLSLLGKEQASAPGHWFAALLAGERPELILSSPYVRALCPHVRAHDTARTIAAALGDLPVRIDERLRETEFGILDGLTTQSVAGGVGRLAPRSGGPPRRDDAPLDRPSSSRTRRRTSLAAAAMANGIDRDLTLCEYVRTG